MRSDSEAIAINLPDIEPIEKPENVKVSLLIYAPSRRERERGSKS